MERQKLNGLTRRHGCAGLVQPLRISNEGWCSWRAARRAAPTVPQWSRRSRPSNALHSSLCTVFLPRQMASIGVRCWAFSAYASGQKDIRPALRTSQKSDVRLARYKPSVLHSGAYKPDVWLLTRPPLSPDQSTLSNHLNKIPQRFYRSLYWDQMPQYVAVIRNSNEYSPVFMVFILTLSRWKLRK